MMKRGISTITTLRAPTFDPLTAYPENKSAIFNRFFWQIEFLSVSDRKAATHAAQQTGTKRAKSTERAGFAQ